MYSNIVDIKIEYIWMVQITNEISSIGAGYIAKARGIPM